MHRLNKPVSEIIGEEIARMHLAPIPAGAAGVWSDASAIAGVR